MASQTPARDRLDKTSSPARHGIERTHACPYCLLERGADVDVVLHRLLRCKPDKARRHPNCGYAGAEVITMLLLVEVLDAVTRVFVVAELRLVLLRIELRRVVPRACMVRGALQLVD